MIFPHDWTDGVSPRAGHASTDAMADAATLLERRPAHLILKHSATCIGSASALDELTAYLDRPAALPLTVVDVARERSLSNALARLTGIRHESPQVLLVVAGVVAWHASHHRVTADSVEAAVRAALQQPGRYAGDSGPSAA